MVCTYIRSKCEVSASEWLGGTCSGCCALPNPSPSGGLLFSQLLTLVLGMASAESSQACCHMKGAAASSRAVSPPWEGTGLYPVTG